MTTIGPILRMAQAATPEQAQQAARDLLAAGATLDVIADALTEFDRLHARSVQVIEVISE